MIRKRYSITDSGNTSGVCGNQFVSPFKHGSGDDRTGMPDQLPSFAGLRIFNPLPITILLRAKLSLFKNNKQKTSPASPSSL